jgi:hypothetical protein
MALGAERRHPLQPLRGGARHGRLDADLLQGIDRHAGFLAAPLGVDGIGDQQEVRHLGERPAVHELGERGHDLFVDAVAARAEHALDQQRLKALGDHRAHDLDAGCGTQFAVHVLDLETPGREQIAECNGGGTARQDRQAMTVRVRRAHDRRVGDPRSARLQSGADRTFDFGRGRGEVDERVAGREVRRKRLCAVDRRLAGRDADDHVAACGKLLRRGNERHAGLAGTTLDQIRERTIEGKFVVAGDLDQSLVAKSFAERAADFAEADEAELDLLAFAHGVPPCLFCCRPA